MRSGASNGFLLLLVIRYLGGWEFTLCTRFFPDLRVVYAPWNLWQTQDGSMF